ncbi:MAG: sulfatase [Rubritalea sp.]|jgi:arylsulfatase A-like enzyme|tara:strand:- start:28 stop:1950 length:1923 start_codon:yes stop_codon:yes gene_type:complete
MKSSNLIPLVAAAFISTLAVASAESAPRPEKPNIILILTDDLGWQDVKCYDIDEPSPMETPNMDALAKKGIKFWQAYSPAPTCAPSRCAIMSGNHPARAQKTHVAGGQPPTPNHKGAWKLIAPWYSGRMPADEVTLAKVLQKNGYTTGHSGKWHMAIDHHAFPQPEDQGFDWTKSDRGARGGMRPDRISGFATDIKGDKFRLDKNGFPYHANSENALTFLKENKDKPFFLYYATWLVHTPIHTRSEQLLHKYCVKLGIDPATLKAKGWAGKGQTNPFYCAMVEELDYYVGKVFNYLESTDDPRWPGHKLSENTYVIFTSDNGGMEGGGGEIYTDNYPLDRGKISAMEGGTRVPLIITGPGIPQGVESDVMINGLDFYPTILSLVGAEKPKDKHLDGCDLTKLLKSPQDASLVRHSDGSMRNSMVWHFPNSAALESTIRIGDYKLVRNYSHINDPKTPELELYQLYQTTDGKQTRVDIEEAKNLATKMPEKAKEMNMQLSKRLTEMKASYPYYNPHFRRPLPHKEKVCKVISHQVKGNKLTAIYKENGAKVVRANLLYTLNGGQRHEEWFRVPATLVGDDKVTVDLPENTTHYVLNLIDENNFLRSYPELPDMSTLNKTKEKFSKHALRVQSELDASGAIK